ncbi:hypothetical protein M422DRAFT_244047 [Sphaerobolus stellatus SS14]|nr:hypothetical protein M422DRAFT_244047 [Sphaerobolus stellatus SS14]
MHHRNYLLSREMWKQMQRPLFYAKPAQNRSLVLTGVAVNVLVHRYFNNVYSIIIFTFLSKDFTQCIDCNVKAERDQPWLYERNPKHSWNNNQGRKSLAEKIELSEAGEEFSEARELSEVSEESSEAREDPNVADNLHYWHHDLVLYTNPEPPIPSISLEERVQNLERKLEEQVEKAFVTVGSRLDKLDRVESLLEALVKGVHS